jgi:tetratricopeptide (TPR) repeat protein
MARQKRVPYRSDAFQQGGRVAAGWFFDRGIIIGIAGALLLAVLVIGVFVSRSSALGDESAWTAYFQAEGKTEKLEAALGAHSSETVRPYVLLALANARLRMPSDDEGKPKPETATERLARLQKAEQALTELVDGFGRHYLRMYGLVLLGSVQEERGEYARAVASFKDALGAKPGSLEPKIKYDIGRNLYLAGKPDEARPFLQRAVELTTKTLLIPERYGSPPSQVKPVWRENAEYLLAKIGRGERAVAAPAAGAAAVPAASAADAPAGAPAAPTTDTAPAASIVPAPPVPPAAPVVAPAPAGGGEAAAD